MVGTGGGREGRLSIRLKQLEVGVESELQRACNCGLMGERGSNPDWGELKRFKKV